MALVARVGLAADALPHDGVGDARGRELGLGLQRHHGRGHHVQLALAPRVDGVRQLILLVEDHADVLPLRVLLRVPVVPDVARGQGEDGVVAP